jgi:prephenate dehydrogenase
MKINIIGDGKFGTFFKEVLASDFIITPDANTIILAVPLSAYEDVASKHIGKHLVNICSVQEQSNKTLLKHSSNVTGLHPLWGVSTPASRRNAIITHESGSDEEKELLAIFSKISGLSRMDAVTHDDYMRRTHLAAVRIAVKIRTIVEEAKDIPNEMIPYSFSLLREFDSIMENMSAGTIESILSNVR